MYKIIEHEEGKESTLCTVTNIEAVKGICEMLNNDTSDGKSYTWEKED